MQCLRIVGKASLVKSIKTVFVIGALNLNLSSVGNNHDFWDRLLRRSIFGQFSSLRIDQLGCTMEFLGIKGFDHSLSLHIVRSVIFFIFDFFDLFQLNCSSPGVQRFVTLHLQRHTFFQELDDTSIEANLVIDTHGLHQLSRCIWRCCLVLAP